MPIQYPRPEEWQTAYNVAPYELDPDGTDNVWQFFRSTESLPPWDEDEHEELRNKSFAIISSYLTAAKYPVLTEIHERSLSGHCISDSNGTRTLFINVVSDPGIVSVDWILSVQRELAEDWPYWRIRIAYWEFGVEPGTCAPNDILIYPDAILVGQRPQELDLGRAIREWRQQSVARYRQTHAPKRRRLRWLEREVPRRMTELAERPFAIVAVFRDVAESRDLISVLFRGKYAERTICNMLTPVDDPIDERGEFAVSKEGEIGAAYGTWTDNLGLWLFGVPCAALHELNVCRIQNPATDDIKYIPEFPLRVEESQIILDEFLADWESTLDEPGTK